MQANLEQPLVSVIIPCYNVSAFVEKAIGSILQQTYKNLEIWIIDDASIDDTLQKINSFTDERIKVIALKVNTQKVGAVNEVLQQVNGEFICFQDADDWSETKRIEEQVNQFYLDAELGICFTNFRYIGSKTFLPGRLAVTNDELKAEFLNFLNKENEGMSLPICPAMMISKVALIKTGGYHPYFAGRVAEDIQWVYRILKDFKGITINKILYNYTIRDGSFTKLQFEGKNAKYAYSWKLLSKIIYKDIHEGIDVLDLKNNELLKKLELEACEETLVETIQRLNETKTIYMNSMNFKIGKFLLTPWRFLASLKNIRTK